MGVLPVVVVLEAELHLAQRAGNVTRARDVAKVHALEAGVLLVCEGHKAEAVADELIVQHGVVALDDHVLDCKSRNFSNASAPERIRHRHLNTQGTREQKRTSDGFSQSGTRTHTNTRARKSHKRWRRGKTKYESKNSVRTYINAFDEEFDVVHRQLLDEHAGPRLALRGHRGRVSSKLLPFEKKKSAHGCGRSFPKAIAGSATKTPQFACNS